MNIETLREFLGWCTVINLGVFFFGVIKILAIRDWASKVHAKMFQVDEASVRQAYFLYLAYYKIAIIVFNLVPYIVLNVPMPENHLVPGLFWGLATAVLPWFTNFPGFGWGYFGVRAPKGMRPLAAPAMAHRG